MSNGPARRRVARRAFVTTGALVLLAASGLSAQRCIHPLDAPPAWISAGGARTSSEGWIGGVEVGRRLNSSISAFGGAEMTDFDRSEIDRTAFRLGGLYRLEGTSPVAACVTAAAEHERIDGLRVYSFPAGVTLGLPWTSDDGSWRFAPLVESRVAYRRATIPGFTRISQPVRVRGGAVLGYRQVFGEALYDRGIVDGRDWTVGVQLGFSF